MREIKFRVFDKNVPKDLVEAEDGIASGMMIPWEHVKESNYLLDALNRKYPIMQYTGLKDKNGKEIYEGDIVNINDGEAIATVFYNKETACFAMMIEDVTPYYKWNKDIEYPLYSAKSLEVIGNIYDNPELLKGEQR